MTRLMAVAVVLWAGLAGASLAQGKTQYRARLSPVPLDVAMQATIAGTGTATASLTGSRLTISGNFSGLKSAATIARVHIADRGLRGAPVFDLTVAPATSGAISGTLDLTPAQVEDLTKSRFYIQIHSEKAPEGNLWGWLLPQEARR
jgi:hypothetical protein